jgi:hypothetical protein
MYKVPKNEISRKYWAHIKHGPYWRIFINLNFIIEKNLYTRCLHKIWKEFISFDMEEQGAN